MPYQGVASPTSLMNKAQVYYEDLSMAQARTVVFLHDWGLSRQEWAYPVAMFGRGYRTITIDLPGFGRSDQPGGLVSYESLARDVGAVMKVLDLNRIILVGAGMGAAVAIAYATRFARSLAGLVLVGALAPRYTQTGGFPHGIARSRVDDLLERTQTNWPELLVDYSKSLCHTAIGDATRQWFINMGLEASLYAVQQTLIHMRDADLRDELKQVSVPTAVFHGVHDAVAPPALGEYLAQAIPGARLFRFENSGHAVWIDEKLRFNTELTGFIEQDVFGVRVPPAGVEKQPGGGERLPYRKIAAEQGKSARGRIEGATGETY
ncbi:MAG TPA: alpha/beta hydrolase [Chloroflexota bacterium]|nr:alpha/beta hydrolase [Chloroflexota bacterium]